MCKLKVCSDLTFRQEARLSRSLGSPCVGAEFSAHFSSPPKSHKLHFTEKEMEAQVER